MIPNRSGSQNVTGDLFVCNYNMKAYLRNGVHGGMHVFRLENIVCIHMYLMIMELMK